MVSMASVRVLRLGADVPYHRALEVQRVAVARLENSGCAVPNTLLLLQHSPVYTVGKRRGLQHEHDGRDEARLRALGADYCQSDRGGLITFHGPGQLVAYPILDLRSLNVSGPRRYVTMLEESVISCCRKMNISANRTSDIGIWVGNNKICALGIHMKKRYFTSHGLALNCSVNLDWFSHIVPCGIHGKSVTSLSRELSRFVSVDEAEQHLLSSLAEIFSCRFENIDEFV